MCKRRIVVYNKQTIKLKLQSKKQTNMHLILQMCSKQRNYATKKTKKNTTNDKKALGTST